MKRRNEYIHALGNFYARTPKAVFAAIAFSYAEHLVAKSEGTSTADCLAQEWKVLFENGIVPQKPPKVNQ